MTERFFAFILVLIFAASASAKELHVVFDLDGTLIQPHDPKIESDPDQIIQFEDRDYRLNDFAPEVLEKLFRAGYKISFFSGGGAERNAVVVKRLQKILFERAGIDFKPYKVLDGSALTPVPGVPEAAKFRERFRKDIQKIAGADDVVLVDDIKEFALPGEERNLLHLSGEIKTVRERQKLLVVMEILLEANDLVKNRKMSYLGAVRGLAEGTAPGGNYDDEVYSEFMSKALRRFNLNAKLGTPSYPRLSITRSCRAIFH